MKQLFLIFLLLSILKAQDSSKVDFLFNFGINASYISGDECQQQFEPHRAPGLHFSLALEKKNKLSDYVGVELAFEMRGGQFGQGIFEAGDGDYVVYSVNYVSITPYFRFKSRVSQLLKNFYVVLGPSLSFALNAEQDWEIETYEGWDYELPPKNFYDQIRKREIGFRYGLSFPVSGSFLADILFYKSLTTLYFNCKTYEYDLNDKCDFKNHSLTIRLGYRF